MTNKQIARFLKETGQLIELTGGNPFRARAFENSARRIERLEEPVYELVESETLTEVDGIGKGLAVQIEELLQRGSFELRDELLAAIPPGLAEMLRVKGLGAKKVRRVWKDLDITTLEELEVAAAAGRLAELEGFGKKTEANVLENIERLKRYRTRRRFAEAFIFATPVLNAVAAIPEVERAEFTGEIRRNMETVAGVDILVATTDAEVVMEAAFALIHRLEPAEHDTDHVTLWQGLIADELPVRLYAVLPKHFAVTQWKLTGSEEHAGAFVEAFRHPAMVEDETEIYTQAGIPFIPPELREQRGEIEAARKGALPHLIEVTDLKGTIHNHSTYSDGAHTLRAMAEAARARGYEYFGICDHSRSLVIANGLSIENVQRQQQEIAALNEEFQGDGGAPFRIFSGIESDILADGSLDYPEEILATFEIIVASIHSLFHMPREEMTRRVIRAIENPFTRILGHATGRQLLVRDGYEIDVDRVLDACAANGVSVEVNANPYRLDLDWRYLRGALDRGILISINPDAHSIDELDYVEWGTRIARKGWLTPAQCLNAKSLPEFKAWIETRRAG